MRFRIGASLGCAIALLSIAARAEPLRIGYVAQSATFGGSAASRAFLDGLREHGYEQGRDYRMEVRSTQGQVNRYGELYAELTKVPVDVFLVTVCGEPLNAARRATQTIPIVVGTCNDDMVATGVIQSYGRPGRNVTGLSKLTPELAPKRLELLKRLIPSLSRVGVLWNPDYSDFKADWEQLRTGATRLGVALVSVEYRRPEEFDSAFESARLARVDAVMEFSDLLSYNHVDRVARAAEKAKLPAMFTFREAPEAGALISYGPSIPAMFRRAADYVVRIHKGAKASELAVEQPTKFELVVNLKAARELELTVPKALLLEATDILQ